MPSTSRTISGFPDVRFWGFQFRSRFTACAPALTFNQIEINNMRNHFLSGCTTGTDRETVREIATERQRSRRRTGGQTTRESPHRTLGVRNICNRCCCAATDRNTVISPAGTWRVVCYVLCAHLPFPFPMHPCSRLLATLKQRLYCFPATAKKKPIEEQQSAGRDRVTSGDEILGQPKNRNRTASKQAVRWELCEAASISRLHADRGTGVAPKMSQKGCRRDPS